MLNSSFIQFRALLARQQLLQQQHHRRLARRVHDDVSQKLTMMALQLSLAALGEKPPANWAQKCQDWNSLVLEVGTVLRDISNELRPRILDDLGLIAALQWFASGRPEGISCQLTAPAEAVVMPPVAANEVFALCREIVADVFAPNGVTQMRIELEHAASLLRLRLRVQAAKPDVDPLTIQSLDALSIYERMACLDGAAEVNPQPGTGFAVTLSVPSARQPVCAAA
jgi:two-component system, NarL family, sensor histidine kinase UhpB